MANGPSVIYTEQANISAALDYRTEVLPVAKRAYASLKRGAIAEGVGRWSAMGSEGAEVIAKITGLPALSGKNSVYSTTFMHDFGMAFEECAREDGEYCVQKQGEHLVNYPPETFVPSVDTALEFGLALQHGEGSYGPDGKKNTWSYQSSQLVVKALRVPVEVAKREVEAGYAKTSLSDRLWGLIGL